uniref:ADP-ribosylation factor-like protein 16 n=2 Tax=Cyanistes caeruleus TaxID=156563 RepID=A0A8C0VDU6_CYACU
MEGHKETCVSTGWQLRDPRRVGPSLHRQRSCAHSTPESPGALTGCLPDGSCRRSAGWIPSLSPAGAGSWLYLFHPETLPPQTRPGLGGCMGPIWHSYYSECSALLFVVDASNPSQVSSSCVQLLSVLSAAPLASVPVLVLFNKIDLPCYMSLVEMKSLFRMQDIVSCATQPITMLETSARDGTGLTDVLQWLRTTLKDPC